VDKIETAKCIFDFAHVSQDSISDEPVGIRPPGAAEASPSGWPDQRQDGDGAGLEHRRLEILGSLTEWCRHCGYEPAAHHRLIVEELEALERGEFTNLATIDAALAG
jgi:hypothetical protein